MVELQVVTPRARGAAPPNFHKYLIINELRKLRALTITWGHVNDNVNDNGVSCFETLRVSFWDTICLVLGQHCVSRFGTLFVLFVDNVHPPIPPRCNYLAINGLRMIAGIVPTSPSRFRAKWHRQESCQVRLQNSMKIFLTPDRANGNFSM